jgi:hypothetical protein
MVEFSNVTEVTTQRAFNTVYQNLTGRPIMVIVNASYQTITAGDGADANAVIGPTDSPTFDEVDIGLPSDSLIPNGIFLPLVFIVPAGYYYKVIANIAGSGQINITHWIEIL